MIVDYLVVLLFLIILIRTIKRAGINNFIGISFMLGLIYFVLRLWGKEIDVSHYLGLVIMVTLAVISYETVMSFFRHICHRKCVAAWLLFVLQIVTSLFLQQYIIRLVNDAISCYPFIGNMFFCVTEILNRGGLVLPIPLDSILATINLVAFLLIQEISKMY